MIFGITVCRREIHHHDSHRSAELIRHRMVVEENYGELAQVVECTLIRHRGLNLHRDCHHSREMNRHFSMAAGRPVPMTRRPILEDDKFVGLHLLFRCLASHPHVNLNRARSHSFEHEHVHHYEEHMSADYRSDGNYLLLPAHSYRGFHRLHPDRCLPLLAN